MIGIVAGEGCTTLELKPIFAKNNIGFHIKLPNFTTDQYAGEWGFAFDSTGIWVMRGLSSRCYNVKLIRWITKKLCEK